jgi:hypothetical protein
VYHTLLTPTAHQSRGVSESWLLGIDVITYTIQHKCQANGFRNPVGVRPRLHTSGSMDGSG